MNRVVKILLNCIFIFFIILLSTYFILRLCGTAEIYKVETGSMEDGIHAGDYILIHKKDNYKIGDVVTYTIDGYHVTHRIIKKNDNKVITKGDANNIEDEEITVDKIVGKVIYDGGILNILIDYKFAIAGGLLAIYLVSYILSKNETEEIEEVKEEKKENKKDNKEEKKKK